jgi:Tol biopolymer transport system component
VTNHFKAYAVLEGTIGVWGLLFPTLFDVLDSATRGWGVSWGTNGTIVFSDGTRLLMVPEAGGKAEVLTTPDQAKGEFRHLLPHVLPGGEAVLFSTQISPSWWDNPRTEVLTLKSGARKILLEEGADARYADSGHILFVRQGTLCAAAFDISRLEVTGAPVQLITNVMQATNAGNSENNTFGAQFAYSASGTLEYVTGGPYPDWDRWLLWIDAKGTAQPVLSPTAPYFAPRVSTDGKRVVYVTLAKKNDIFVADMERGVSMPLRFGGRNLWPLWTPDGRRVTFTRQEKSGRWRILCVSADGGGEAESLVESDRPVYASSWSSTGDRLAYIRSDSTAGLDIWVLQTKKSEAFLNTRFSEAFPEFSPDGQWLAYVSDESGRAEVYVQSYPDKNKKIQISSGGGSAPCWKRDGRQLYFLSNTGLMMVDVAAGPTFGTARVLLDYYGYGFAGTIIRSYDLHPDGMRFLAMGDIIGGKPLLRTEIPEAFRQALTAFDSKELARFEYWLSSDPQRRLSPSLEQQLREPGTVQINIVLDWFEELKSLILTGKK